MCRSGCWRIWLSHNFLTNLASKAQAGADTTRVRERLGQTDTLLDQANERAEEAHQQVQQSLAQGHMPPNIANQLSDNLAQIQQAAQSRPEVPPE